MNIEQLHEHCMAVKGAEVSTPFIHHNEAVYKVMGKMFAFASLKPKDGIFVVNLKCDPERSVELRERYHGINPGHVPTTLLWNGVTLESDVPDELIVELIAHSVDEVIKKLPKARQKEYELL